MRFGKRHARPGRARRWIPLIPVCTAGALALGCSGSSFNDCSKTQTCQGGGGNGGSGGASTGGTGGVSGNAGRSGAAGVGGAGGAPPACDASSDPSVDACVIDERYGVFASPVGNDSTADGSRKAPYKTLTAALKAAKSAGKHVYACADGGPFSEALDIQTALDGSKLYGGFKCGDWTYHAGVQTPLEAPTPTALSVANLQTGLTIEDFDIKAANATAPGGSSFAAFVVGSQNVVFRRTALTAGNGAKGADGTDGSKGSDGAVPTTAQNGKAPYCTGSAQNPGGAWSAANSCGSLGGRGGYGVRTQVCPATRAEAGSGESGTPTSNLVAAAGGGGGGAYYSFNCSGPGGAGSAPSAGTDGSDGKAGMLGPAAPPIGSFSETGYTPADGGSGTSGFVGQGGGGGGGALGDEVTCVGQIGPSGGAGGMGGCQGTLGTLGAGGGASVGLFTWFSAVELADCKVAAGNGGAGGKGGNGGLGGAAGTGGTGFGTPGTIAASMPGGKGGKGGDGGSGSGGTGGPSIAIAYHGTAATQTNVALAVGDGGAVGNGGSVNNRPAPSGSTGQVAQLYEQK